MSATGNAGRGTVLRELRKNSVAYLMTVPGLVFLILFCYVPLAFIVIIFKSYNAHDGVFGSPWAQPLLRNFEFFFGATGKALRATANTLALNVLFIATSLVLQMGLAILLNEIRAGAFKRIAQSIFFFPYFLSYVVIGAIVYNLFSSEYGSVNVILQSLGLPRVNWYQHPEYWKGILVGVNAWKWTGYGALIYMSAMAGFDTACYEAAVVDGAGAFQRIRSLTIPMLVPTATVLVLFDLGRIFFGDFGMVYGTVRDVGTLLATTEVIDTYVFRSMRQTGDFAMASAVGILQSLMGLSVIMACNALSRRINDGTSLF
jgi:putative aldouronate transport system permease protein